MASGMIGLVTDQPGYRTRINPACHLPRAGRWAALVMATSLLGACAFDPPTIERIARDNVGSESTAKSRLATRKGTPSGTAATTSAPGDISDIPGGETAARDVDVTNFKERLIGLDSDEISDLMGTPGLERAEPPALIWQYRHQICTVDIFMFDDGGGAAVDHVEVRPTQQGAAVDEKACFTALTRTAPVAAKAGSQASAPAQQPIAPSPSTPVSRRAQPSAAPPTGGLAATPSSQRGNVPVPSTAAPSAAPARPAAPPTGDMDEASPEDTDVDFDMGTPPPAGPAASAPASAPKAPASAAAAPKSAAPSAAAPAASAPSNLLDIPDDFLSSPSPTPAPSAAPASTPASPGPSSSLPPLDEFEMGTPSASAPAAPAKPAEPTAAATPKPSPGGPAALAPRTAAKGASASSARGAAVSPSVDDETRDRIDDDPAHNDNDMVE